MGAYYTKEDITEYISKNTIIPASVRYGTEVLPDRFRGRQLVWRLLQTEPDRYIHAAMLKGIGDGSCPSDIAAG